jgi:uncharacterized protein (TIGR03067 family)
VSIQLLLIWAAGLVSVVDRPLKKDELLKKEWKLLRGTWEAVSLVINGEKNQSPNATVVVQQNRWTLRINNQVLKGTLTIDVTRSPRTFDAKVTEGFGEGTVVLGIYQIDGNTWRLCWSTEYDGKTRPTELTGKAGSQQLYFLWKRKRP